MLGILCYLMLFAHHTATYGQSVTTSSESYRRPLPYIADSRHGINQASFNTSSAVPPTMYTNDTSETSRPLISNHPCGDYTWQLYLKIACIPAFTIIGLIGNTLAFIVMCQPCYNRRSYSHYLRALAIFDNMTLLTTLINETNFIRVAFGHESFLMWHTDFTCKFTEWLRHVVYVVSSWLIVCFTLDRYIAVCHPLQRPRLCTGTRAVVTMVSVFLMAMVTQVFRFFYIERLDRSQPCHAQPEVRLQYFGWHYFWFSFLLRFFIPFTTLALCNGMIIFHIQKMRKVRKKSKERERARNANMAIYTLYVVCSVFVITLFPNAILGMMHFTEFVIYKRAHMFCVLRTMDVPFQMIRLVNYSVNFFLYGLTGRQFRREVTRLFGKCKRALQFEREMVEF